MKKYMFTFWVIVLMVPTLASAGWFDFAKPTPGIPEINELQIGDIQLENLPDLMECTRSDLDGGKLVVRGFADIMEGKVGAVMITLDGDKWEKANLKESGHFYFEFQPVFDHEYEFGIKALSTTGKSSDMESFPLIVRPESLNDLAKKAFSELLKFYMTEDRMGFLNMISPDFEGDLNSLEEAVEDDFRFLNNIQIKATVSRVVSINNEYEIVFIFERRVQSTRSGQILTDRSSSSVTLVREGEGFKLMAIAMPAIFGVSNQTEVATSVEDDAVGQNILILNEDGEATTVTQQETVEETTTSSDSGDIDEGSATLQYTFSFSLPGSGTGDGFILSSQIQQPLSNADIFAGNLQGADFAINVEVETHLEFITDLTGEGRILDLGVGTLAQHTSVPAIDEGNYQQAITFSGPSVVAGGVYAFYTGDIYALIRVTTVTDQDQGGGQRAITIAFQYKVQQNGTPNF